MIKTMNNVILRFKSRSGGELRPQVKSFERELAFKMGFANYELGRRCLQFYKRDKLMPRTIVLLIIWSKKRKVKGKS